MRPEYLKRRKKRASELSHADFKKIEDRAVNEAIDIQLKAGSMSLRTGNAALRVLRSFD
jgi:methionine synthase II (cobalamin-independent)